MCGLMKKDSWRIARNNRENFIFSLNKATSSEVNVWKLGKKAFSICYMLDENTVEDQNNIAEIV